MHKRSKRPRGRSRRCEIEHATGIVEATQAGRAQLAGAGTAPRPGSRTTIQATCLLLAALLASAGAARAAEELAAGHVAQANNPLANFTAFNLHNYYIDGPHQWQKRRSVPDALRQAVFARRDEVVDARLLPVNSFPVGPAFQGQTGVGDFNVIAPCLIDTGNAALSVGVGQQLTAPTATRDALGGADAVAGDH